MLQSSALVKGRRDSGFNLQALRSIQQSSRVPTKRGRLYLVATLRQANSNSHLSEKQSVRKELGVSSTSASQVDVSKSIGSTEDELFDLWSDLAPGAGGKKRFPSNAVEDDAETPHAPADEHRCMSTKQCYEEFPFLIKASCPLNIPQDNQAAGEILGRCPDAGPGTGKRRFPSLRDDADDTQLAGYRPNHLNTKEDNLREVAMRRSC